MLYAPEQVAMPSLEQLNDFVAQSETLKLSDTHPFEAYAIALLRAGICGGEASFSWGQGLKGWRASWEKDESSFLAHWATKRSGLIDRFIENNLKGLVIIDNDNHCGGGEGEVYLALPD